jgi:beta-lactamase regulating signal transducer with metallopeptidase domain
MSLSGSIIALLLFALKPLIKNRLPKSVQYYLWLIVIAALLVPVSKFVSIPQYAEHIPPVPIYSIVEWNVISTQEQNERILRVKQEIPLATDFSSQESPLSGAVDIAFVIYPIGIAVILLYHILSYVLFLKKMRKGNICADVDCEIPVYINPKATTPMLVGLFRPKIHLPEREYSDEQLQAVLLHEMTHLRRKDILVKWLSVLACAVHWFNPFVWLVRREIDRTCELSCDEAVIARLDTSGRQTYGDTLIYVAADHKPHTALAMSESGRNLKERLGAIMKSKKQTRIAVIVSAVLLIAVAVVAIILGGGSADKDPDGFPVITVLAGNGSASTAVPFGYERVINDVIEIGDALSPLQHAYTEENTIYTTSLDIPEQLSLTGAEFTPLGYTLFNLTTGDVVSEVDLSTILDTREKLTIGAPTDAGEYVFVIPFRISELGFTRIEYAFKVVVTDESGSADTGYLKSAVFAVGDEQDGYLFGVNFVMPMNVSVGGNSKNPPIMPGTLDCWDIVNEDGEKVGCVGYNLADYDKLQTAATFVYNSLSDMPGNAALRELGEGNYGIVSYSKDLPVYVAFEFEKSAFTVEEITAIAESLEFIGKGIGITEDEIPEIQIFVYDDGQGNECYVIFEDNAKHSREEIMSAQTVTIDEINEVFAKFTSKFRFEIRAMSHDDFDKVRLDKISSQIVFPDGLDRSGVISFYGESE